MSAIGTKQTCSMLRRMSASPSRLTRLDCLLCRDPRRMDGTPLQLAPVWDSGWGKYNASG